MEVFLVIGSILLQAVGPVGGLLGIISWYKTYRKQESRERQEKEMYELWALFAQAQAQRISGVSIFNPEAGSKEHRLAEKLVALGMFERSPMGGYCIPGKYQPPNPYR